jgi:ATP-binding cassette subfamily B protein
MTSDCSMKSAASGSSPRRDGYATILISHRLNTIRDADRILVLVDGILTEQGSHADLMALDGTYTRLFSLQARGFANTGAGDG